MRAAAWDARLPRSAAGLWRGRVVLDCLRRDGATWAGPLAERGDRPGTDGTPLAEVFVRDRPVVLAALGDELRAAGTLERGDRRVVGLVALRERMIELLAVTELDLQVPRSRGAPALPADELQVSDLSITPDGGALVCLTAAAGFLLCATSGPVLEPRLDGLTYSERRPAFFSDDDEENPLEKLFFPPRLRKLVAGRDEAVVLGHLEAWGAHSVSSWPRAYSVRGLANLQRDFFLRDDVATELARVAGLWDAPGRPESGFAAGGDDAWLRVEMHLSLCDYCDGMWGVVLALSGRGAGSCAIVAATLHEDSMFSLTRLPLRPTWLRLVADPTAKHHSCEIVAFAGLPLGGMMRMLGPAQDFSLSLQYRHCGGDVVGPPHALCAASGFACFPTTEGWAALSNVLADKHWHAVRPSHSSAA